jgi:hypothetical protein
MDWLTTLTTAFGAAWLSGINLYATVVTLGLLQRFGLARLPGDLAVLSHDWIMALLVGGGLALGSHGSKAVTRVGVNTTLPGAGAVVSVAEDAFAVGFAALMTFFPLAFLALLVLALIGTAWLIPKIVRALRRMLGVLRGSRAAPQRR